MKIAVSATGTGLDSSVDPSFEHCAYFVIVDTDSGAVEATANPEAVGGARTQAAQWLLAQGAAVVMTGRCGQQTARVLADADICVIEGVFGNVGMVTASVQGAIAPTNGGTGFGDRFRTPGTADGRDAAICRWVGGWRGQGSGRWHGPGRGMGRAGRG